MTPRLELVSDRCAPVSGRRELVSDRRARTAATGVQDRTAVRASVTDTARTAADDARAAVRAHGESEAVPRALRLIPNRAPLRPESASSPGGCPPQRARRAFRRSSALLAEERGAVTAEYAIVIMAAVAFAGLLVAIMRSDEIRAMLVQLVENALGAGG